MTYTHPYDSMRRYAELLALRHDSARTRHSYYRAMRLVHEHFGADPSTLGEDQFRDYILHVKTRKAWKPKTIRQTVACARLFFTGMLGLAPWTVFSQIRTKDHDELSAVLTRDQSSQAAAGRHPAAAVSHPRQTDLLRGVAALRVPLAHRP